MKPYLKNNDIEIYSTHNEGKSVTAERFIRTSKNKIYKYMTSISKNVYFDKSDDIVNKYNNTYHLNQNLKLICEIKMKPVDETWNLYIDSSKKINGKDPKFKVGDIFAPQIGLKKFLWLKKLKLTRRGFILLETLM